MTRADTLIAAVQTRLALIRKGATLTVKGRAYTVRTDYGRDGCLTLRRQAPLTEKETELLNLFPALPQRQLERAEFGLDRYRLEIAVDIAARGRDAVATVTAVADDIRQAIASDPRFGGLARHAEVDFDGLNQELLGQAVAGVPTGRIIIEYTVNSGEV